MIKEELNSMFVNLHTWGETLFSFPSMTNCEVVQVSLATWHTWKGSRSTQEPRKPLFRPLTRVSSSILSSQKLDVQSVTRGTHVQCVQGHVAHLEGI